MRRLSLAAALLALVFAAAPAQAQTKKAAAAAPAAATTVGGPTMDNQISAWGILAYRYSWSTGYGLGARYQKVLIPQGVLKLQNGIRDEIGIEGGIDYTHYSWDYTFGDQWDFSYNRFDVVVGGTWNFWLNDQLAVYPKLDIGFGFGSVSSDLDADIYEPDVDPLFFQAAAGVVYKLDRLFLRAELGSAMLRLGASFQF